MRINRGPVGAYAPEVDDGVVLQPGGVHGVQAVDEALHDRAEGVVQAVGGYPCRVAADRGVLFHAQHRVGGGVDLEGGVGVEVA